MPGLGQSDSKWESKQSSGWCPTEEVKEQFMQDWDYFRPSGPNGEPRRGSFPTGLDIPSMLAEVVIQPVVSLPSKTLVIKFVQGGTESEKLQDAANAERIKELSDDEE